MSQRRGGSDLELELADSERDTMQKIPLMLAKAGMILSRDVFRSNTPTGMPICGQNTVLTDDLIRHLDQQDVQSVCVQGHPVWEEGAHSYEDLLRELDRRFEKTMQDPLNVILYDIHKAHLMKSMEGESGKPAE